MTSGLGWLLLNPRSSLRGTILIPFMSCAAIHSEGLPSHCELLDECDDGPRKEKSSDRHGNERSSRLVMHLGQEITCPEVEQESGEECELIGDGPRRDRNEKGDRCAQHRSERVRQVLFRVASMNETVFRPSAKSCATTARSTTRPTVVPARKLTPIAS